MEASKATVEPSINVGHILRKVLNVPEVGIIIPLVLFALIFNALNPAMLSGANISVMLRTISYVGIIAVGQALLMISGEIDLSVGAVTGFCAVFSAWLMAEQGWSIPVGVLAGLLAGCTIGLINGLLTVKVGLPAFIVTLGMLFTARGANYVISQGTYIYGLPESFGEFGTATPLGLSWAFVIFIVLMLIGDFVLRFTIFGSMVTATGGNQQAAKVAGINTDWVKISCFMLTSSLAAVAGILVTANLKSADYVTGFGWELAIIAGVVIGGVSLFGGVGTVLGAFLGTLLMQEVRSGLVIVGVNINWQNVAVGMILAAAGSMDLLRRRAKKY
jgi:ribose transport system permease protein